jgi:hypothetical protein
MANFFSDIASYGRPAEYVPRDIELEGTYLALSGYQPKEIKTSLGNLGEIQSRYLDLYKNSFEAGKEAMMSEAEQLYSNMGQQGSDQTTKDAKNLNAKWQPFFAAHNQFANMTEEWRKELKTIKDPDRRTEAENMFNIAALEHLEKNKGIPNPSGAPFFNVPQKVNIRDIGAKALSTIAEQVREQIPAQHWKEIEADKTKLLSYWATIKTKPFEKIEDAVTNYLENDPEVLADLKFQAGKELFYRQRLTSDPIEKEHLKSEKENLAEIIMSEKIYNISRNIARSAEVKDVTYQQSIITDRGAELELEWKKNNPNYSMVTSTTTKNVTFDVEIMKKGVADLNTNITALEASLAKLDPNSENYITQSNNLTALRIQRDKANSIINQSADAMQNAGYKYDIDKAYSEYSAVIEKLNKQPGRSKEKGNLFTLLDKKTFEDKVKGKKAHIISTGALSGHPDRYIQRYKQEFSEKLDAFTKSGTYSMTKRSITDTNKQSPTVQMDETVKKAVFDTRANMSFFGEGAEKTVNMLQDFINNYNEKNSDNPISKEKSKITNITNPHNGIPTWNIELRDSKGNLISTGESSFIDKTQNPYVSAYATELYKYNVPAEGHPVTPQVQEKLNESYRIKGYVNYGEFLDPIRLSVTEDRPLASPIRLPNGIWIDQASKHKAKETAGFYMFDSRNEMIKNEFTGGFLFSGADDILRRLGADLIKEEIQMERPVTKKRK